MHKRRIYKANPFCGWRTSRSRARSSRMYHTSYPVPSCSSPCIFGLGFLQTPPHDDDLALLLTFGSAKTWCGDLHLASYVPCLAQTYLLAAREPSPLDKYVSPSHFKLLSNSCTSSRFISSNTASAGITLVKPALSSNVILGLLVCWLTAISI